MQKKSYCFFSAQYLPHMGGVENYTYHLAKELVRRGNKVTIVTSNVENVDLYEKKEGIEVFRIPCWNLLDGRFPVLKVSAFFLKVNKELKKRNYDMVIVNTRFYLHSIYGAIYAKKKKIRCIFIEHGTGHLSLHNPVLDNVENIVEHSMTLVEKKLCNEFYGVSNACLEWLQHFHINGKGVLYNAIDLEDIKEKSEKKVKDYRKMYNIPQKAIIISFTGRLLKEKGIFKLINSVENIINENSNIYLLIAGDGPEWKNVKEKESAHIIVLGRINSEEIVALLNQTDIFCLPSDSEGMPTSVLEAAACKAYIITTKKGGAKELICNKSYGIIMDSNDVTTVEKTLKRALPKGEERKKAVDLTYQRLKNMFTWEKVAEKLMNI